MDNSIYDKLEPGLLAYAEAKAKDGTYPKSARIEEILYKEKKINEQAYISLTCENLGIKYIDLNDERNLDPAMIKLVPQSTAKKYSVIPVSADDSTITVVMQRPDDLGAISGIKMLTGKKVKRAITNDSAFERALVNFYSQENTEAAKAILEKEIGDQASLLAFADNKFDLTGDDKESSEVKKIVNNIFERAISERASDIHIEPCGNIARVRLRLDGRLKTVETYPLSLHPRICAFIKLNSGMDVSNRFTTQDGRSTITYMSEGRKNEADLRLSIMPASKGEDIVIRILLKTGSTLVRENLGLTPADLLKYDALIKNSYGIILMVGPTGSGKSTTMNTMVKILNREDRKIVTLENPVEYEVDGVAQVQTNDNLGLTFESGLEAAMRHDPDIICVGEIRNEETASIAVQSALTGHIVLSTLHTNNSLLAVNRLEKLGVEPYNIADSVIGIVSQRLARRICPVCKEEYVPSPGELTEKGFSSIENARRRGYRFYRGRGCPACLKTGYKGRTGIFEILIITKELRQAIVVGKPYDELYDIARKNGLILLRENFKKAVLDGVTTLEEYNSVINKFS